MNFAEISVQEVAEKRANKEDFFLLDVREPFELQMANLGEDVLTASLSQISEQLDAALPEAICQNKDVQIIVMCHHGGRSAQVANWLAQNGWLNVFNMVGGIDAYAVAIDPSIGRY